MSRVEDALDVEDAVCDDVEAKRRDGEGCVRCMDAVKARVVQILRVQCRDEDLHGL